MNRRKMLAINSCSDCPHLGYDGRRTVCCEASTKTGNRKIRPGYRIPVWCPLPDAPEEKA
jgi:hypothetical protein